MAGGNRSKCRQDAVEEGSYAAIRVKDKVRSPRPCCSPAVYLRTVAGVTCWTPIVGPHVPIESCQWCEEELEDVVATAICQITLTPNNAIIPFAHA
jgi:hypothetical protein